MWRKGRWKEKGKIAEERKKRENINQKLKNLNKRGRRKTGENERIKITKSTDEKKQERI